MGQVNGAQNTKESFMNILDLFKRVAWVWESHLVNRLGINRDELRKLRAALLTEGTDWRTEKKRVEISKSGAEKLVAHLKTASAPQQSRPEEIAAAGTSGTPPEKNAPPAAVQEAAPEIEKSVEILVHRTFPKNKHIIEGYFKGTDPVDRKNIVRVKVKDATRFTRFDNTGQPLALACRLIQADFYEFTGPLPKRKGRL